MFTGKRIIIWGNGREGLAVKKYLDEKGFESSIVEGKSMDLTNVDIIFKSPGISLYNPYIQQALKQGIEVLSGTNLFMMNVPKTTKTIAITGTKGKSTTSSLLAHILKSKGFNVGFGGNIGIPLIELAGHIYDYVVAEVSSYQCADLSYPFDISVILNLYPEHIDWHGSHDKYYEDKLNLLRIRQNGQIGILNALNEETLKRTAGYSDLIYFNDSNGFYVENGHIMYKNDILYEAGEIKNLKGEHNLQNICAVLTVLKALNVDFDGVKEAILSFQALPHRLQTVACINNVSFVDDSISTTPQTAIAALKAFDSMANHIYLLVGGYDRQQNYSELLEYVAHKSDKITLITLPLTGSRIVLEAKNRNLSVTEAENIPEAVKIAKEQARAGDVVLLSPAAPSYHAYKNFEERGEDFSHCVVC